jgi:hypothetical protein
MKLPFLLKWLLVQLTKSITFKMENKSNISKNRISIVTAQCAGISLQSADIRRVDVYFQPAAPTAKNQVY